ncbi:Cap-gly domain linker [Thalictrum thalictroides]|uniref:Cap-gly domain linker n=1 Tax=Thalictrum thalictroides TaxID=46969 RepID=A0A7J6UUL0_THATH|nr:Cap-gly domain linker [Thalictrum thalictroides]
MDDSGAILCQVSCLKDMLDRVNEEIEENIQTTREIESEVVKCSEIESGLILRESELMKMKCASEFEVNGLIQVATIASTSVEALEKELSCLRIKREETLKRMTHKRNVNIALNLKYHVYCYYGVLGE